MTLDDVSLSDAIAIAGALGSVAGVLYAVGRASKRLDEIEDRHATLAKEAREGLSLVNARISALEVFRGETTMRLEGLEKQLDRIETKLDDALARPRT